MDFMEKLLSTGQIQDGLGKFRDAAKREAGLWTPDQEQVPRPLFSAIQAAAAAKGILPRNGKIEVLPGQEDILAPGVRGVARFAVKQSVVTAPAIVLSDGRTVGVLLGQRKPEELDTLTQAALENVYVTQDPAITAHEGGRVNPIKGGHALVAASFIGGGNVHTAVHGYGNANFGTAFDREGKRSVRIGHDEWNPRSAVLPLAQVLLAVAPGDQLLPGQDVLGTGYSASELNVAMTAAATLSHNPQFDPAPNIAGMIGA
jgi:hypothetical protein